MYWKEIMLINMASVILTLTVYTTCDNSNEVMQPVLKGSKLSKLAKQIKNLRRKQGTYDFTTGTEAINANWVK